MSSPSDDKGSGPEGQDGLGDRLRLEPALHRNRSAPSSSPHPIFAPPSLPPTPHKPYDVAAELDYFLGIPWCRAHLLPQDTTAGTICVVQPNSRRAGRPVPDPTADGCFVRSDGVHALDTAFSNTLHTPDTLGAFLVFYEEPPAAHLPVVEIKALVHLGPGLNGHRGIAHGGIVATLLDEILGLLIPLNQRRARRAPGGVLSVATPGEAPATAPTAPPATSPPETAAVASAGIALGFVTGYLHITYLRPVRTSRPVLVTARYTRTDGPRKFLVEGSIWDGEAREQAHAEALFIALKEKL